MKVVIEGAGEVGSHLAKMLSREGNDVTVIDSDDERLSRLSAYADVQTISGSPTSIKTLKEADAAKAELFIAVMPFSPQEVNVVGAMLAKQLGASRVLARINDEDYLTAENRLMFKEMGIELMFYPEKIAADEIVDQLKHSASSETMDFAHGKLQIAVFKLDERSPLIDVKLSDFMQSVGKPDNEKFRIIAISRDEQTSIPGVGTKFQFGDILYTISTREGVSTVVEKFGIQNIEIGSAMIIGGTPMARMVATSLSKTIDEIKIIDKDRECCLELSEKLPESVSISCGDARDSDFLYEEGIRNYDAFIALTGRDETNVLACVVAKKFGVARTIAEVENIEYIRLAEEMGVDTIINKKLITAGKIFKFTLSGKARFVKYMSGTDAEVMEYTVAPGSAVTKGPLKDIGFPKNAIIGGVVRGSESFIAVGSTVIEAYDRVAVFALPQTIKEIDRFFK